MEMCNYIGKHVSYQIACLPALFTINSLYAPRLSGLYCRLFFLFARAHIKSSVIIFDRVNASIVTLFLCKFRNYMHNAFNNGGAVAAAAFFCTFLNAT
jgi:hypothetical protein